MEQQPDRGDHTALVIAVGGGKGGVGKSVIAANLAVAIAKLGARVVAIDADLGSANLHTLFGVDHASATLQAFIDGRCERLDELTIASGLPRLSLIAGSVAVPGAANLQHSRKQKLLRHIAKLETDIVVVDCGAGVHYNVVDFFAAADTRLLVTSAQLISLQNAYGFLKASVYRTLRHCATDAGRARLIEQSTSDTTEVETIRHVLERIDAEDPELSRALQAELARTRVQLLGNQLADLRELKALNALSRMIGDFLGVQVPVIGGLCRRDRIHAAVTQRRPFMLDGGADPESQVLLSLAASYLERCGFVPLGSQPPAADSKYERQRTYARSSPDWPAVSDTANAPPRPGKSNRARA